MVKFLDCQGVERPIPELPLTLRSQFLKLHPEIIRRVAVGESIQELYDLDSEFRNLTNRVLGMFSISPEWVSEGMLEELLIDPGYLKLIEFGE
jgi:hypothetical protein